MGILSEEYIMRRLNKYADSKAGKERIAQLRRDIFNGNKGGGTGALTRARVEQVLNEVADKFISAVITVINSFRYDGVHTIVMDMDKNGYVKASITVDEDALRRESLHYMNKNLSIGHGEGVEDILALFTHGYTITGRRPYGFWVRDNISSETGHSLDRIGALTHRDPNPFLLEFVDEINEEYQGVCEITLNDKYKNEGGG